MHGLARPVKHAHPDAVSRQPDSLTIFSRQDGKTTRQLLAAPQGAAYIWVNDLTHYPGDLARFLGRGDLKIISPDEIRRHAFRNRPMVVDHAARLPANLLALVRHCNERFAR